MMMQNQNLMVDSLGRRMKKLRLSLLDACNFRCIYCMPEKAKFLPQKDWLSTDELVRMTAHFIHFGIEEVRLTGGEPTLRKDWLAIAQRLSDLPLKKLGLTTNGFNLYPSVKELAESQCQYLNISIDSLKREKFNRITRMNAFDDVMKSIFAAKEFGFKLKLNVVLMKTINDDEILDFVDFSAKYGIEVRFLETMNIGVARPFFETWFISAEQMIEKIKPHFHLNPIKRAVDDTAFSFGLDNGARVGFISSESQSFCNGCSRLRLDAKGVLRPCLFKDTGLSFKGLEREEYPEKLKQVIRMKPADRIKELIQPMYQVGG